MAKGINKKTGRSSRRIDRVGVRSGRLVFTKEVGMTIHKHAIWEALCDCGNITTTVSPNKTKSCGCLQKELAAKRQSEKKLPESEKRKRLLKSRKKYREKIKQCPVKQMQQRLSRLHRLAIAEVGAIKTSPTFESLGYTVDEFCKHIERQFTNGMSWNNMKLWQIDHITPIAKAKTKKDVFDLNQLSNLRPMWAMENNLKRNKIEVLI